LWQQDARRQPASRSLARRDVALDPAAQLLVAAEVGELAELLVELEAHVREVGVVRRDDPVGADVAEPVEADLVQRAQESADLPVDVRQLVVAEPVEQRADVLALELRQHEHVLAQERLRVVGREDDRHRRRERVAAQQPVDEDLLLHLPVEVVGVDLDHERAAAARAHLEDRTVGAAVEPRDRFDAQTRIGECDHHVCRRRIEIELVERHLGAQGCLPD
jgi:hypothetical protein